MRKLILPTRFALFCPSIVFIAMDPIKVPGKQNFVLIYLKVRLGTWVDTRLLSRGNLRKANWFTGFIVMTRMN